MEREIERGGGGERDQEIKGEKDTDLEGGGGKEDGSGGLER